LTLFIGARRPATPSRSTLLFGAFGTLNLGFAALAGHAMPGGLIGRATQLTFVGAALCFLVGEIRISRKQSRQT